MLKKVLTAGFIFLVTCACSATLEFGPIVGIEAGSPGDGVPAVGGTFALYAGRFDFMANGAFVPKEGSKSEPGSYVDESVTEYTAGGASVLYKIKRGGRSFAFGARYRYSRESYYHHEGRTGLAWSHEDYVAHDHRFLAVGGLQLYRDGEGHDGAPFAFLWGGAGPAMVRSRGIRWRSEGGGGYPEDYEEESLTGTAFTLDLAFGFDLTWRMASFFGVCGLAEANAKTLRFSGPAAVGETTVDVRAFVGPIFLL